MDKNKQSTTVESKAVLLVIYDDLSFQTNVDITIGQLLDVLHLVTQKVLEIPFKQLKGGVKTK